MEPRFAPRLDIFAFYSYYGLVIDPEASLPRPHKTLIYLGACLIAGMRLVRERKVDSRELPVRAAIDQAVDLSHEIFNRIFRKAYARLREI